MSLPLCAVKNPPGELKLYSWHTLPFVKKITSGENYEKMQRCRTKEIR